MRRNGITCFEDDKKTQEFIAILQPPFNFTNHYMRYHSVKPNSSEKTQLPHASDQITIDRTIEVLFSILVVIAPLLYYPHIVNFSNLPKTLVIQSGLCAIFLLWIIRWMTCFRVKIFIHPVFTWVWMWLLWSGITILWSVDKFSGFNTWLHWVICALGMNVLISPAPSLEKIDRIILVSCLGAGMVSFIGILQYVCGLDLIPQSFVPGATFSNKNIAAEFVGMIWPLSIMGFVLSSSSGKSAFLTMLSSLLTVFLLYAKTRAVWVSLLLNLLIFGLFILSTGFWKEIKPCITRQKGFCIAAFAGIVAVMATIPPSTPLVGTSNTATDTFLVRSALASEPQNGANYGTETEKTGEPSKLIHNNSSQESSSGNLPSLLKGYDEIFYSIFKIHEGSANFRLTAWVNTLRMISDHLWGVGLGNWYVYYPLYHRAVKADPFFSLERQPLHPHNEVLQILAETSGIGLICFLGIFVVTIRGLFSVKKSSMDSTVKIRMVFSVMAVGCFFINSLFSFPLRMSIPPLYLMMLLSIIISLDLRSRSVPAVSLPLGNGLGYTLVAGMLTLFTFVTVFNVKMIISDFHYSNTKYFHSQKNWKSAKIAAEKAASNNPFGHKIWLELGIADNNLGLYDQAIIAFNQALGIHPHHLNSLMNISHACFQMKRFGESADHMKLALKISPDNDKAHYNLGLIHEKLMNYPDAIQNYQAALGIRDSNIDARFRLALALFHENQLTESHHQLTQIIAEKPDFRSAHYYLGLIYTKWNMMEKATEAYRTEIKFHPDHTQAMKHLTVADSLKW
jgi:Tfp pilus assembly protein PilF